MPGKLNIASRKLSDPGGDGGMYLENPQTLGPLGRVTHMVGVVSPSEALWQGLLPGAGSGGGVPSRFVSAAVTVRGSAFGRCASQASPSRGSSRQSTSQRNRADQAQKTQRSHFWCCGHSWWLQLREQRPSPLLAPPRPLTLSEQTRSVLNVPQTLDYVVESKMQMASS